VKVDFRRAKIKHNNMVTLMQWCGIEENIKDGKKQDKNNKDDRMKITIKNMKEWSRKGILKKGRDE